MRCLRKRALSVMRVNIAKIYILTSEINDATHGESHADGNEWWARERSAVSPLLHTGSPMTLYHLQHRRLSRVIDIFMRRRARPFNAAIYHYSHAYRTKHPIRARAARRHMVQMSLGGVLTMRSCLTDCEYIQYILQVSEWPVPCRTRDELPRG